MPIKIAIKTQKVRFVSIEKTIFLDLELKFMG
jgi:hypothetical protein